MNPTGIHLRALEPTDLDFLFSLENDQRLWTVSNTLAPFSKFTLKKIFLRLSSNALSLVML